MLNVILIEESIKGFEVHGMPDDENRIECVPKVDFDNLLFAAREAAATMFAHGIGNWEELHDIFDSYQSIKESQP